MCVCVCVEGRAAQVCVCVCRGAGSPRRCCWRLEREEENIDMDGSLPGLHTAAQAHAGRFQTHFSKVESDTRERFTDPGGSGWQKRPAVSC